MMSTFFVRNDRLELSLHYRCIQPKPLQKDRGDQKAGEGGWLSATNLVDQRQGNKHLAYTWVDVPDSETKHFLCGKDKEKSESLGTGNCIMT